MCNQSAEGAPLLLAGVQIASKHLGNPETIASFNGFEALAVDISEGKSCVHTCARACNLTCVYMYVCIEIDR